MTEERIITETGTDARIAAIIEPVIESMGYRLVRVRLSAQNGLTMQIMAERPDGTMTVTDCEAISRGISPVLDVEDPVDKAYHLEVSSAGIDRPLVRISDFKRWEGYLVRVDTSQIVAGRKRFRGYLRDVTDTGFVMERDQPAYGEENRAEIAFSEVGEAKLVLSDDLIRESLRADKAAMKARAEAEGFEGDDTSDDADDVSTDPQDEN